MNVAVPYGTSLPLFLKSHHVTLKLFHLMVGQCESIKGETRLCPILPLLKEWLLVHAQELIFIKNDSLQKIKHDIEATVESGDLTYAYLKSDPRLSEDARQENLLKKRREVILATGEGKKIIDSVEAGFSDFLREIDLLVARCDVLMPYFDVK